MTANLINELPEQRFSDDKQGVRTFKRVYLVQTNESSDDANTAVNATGIPRRFEPLILDSATDYTMLVVNRSAFNISGEPDFYHVQVQYSSKFGEPKDDNENPALRPTKFRMSFEKFQKPFIAKLNKDKDGAGLFEKLADGFDPEEEFEGAVVNSAGEPFDPPPMMDDSRPVLSIIRNEGSFSGTKAAEFMDTVNNATFYGVAAGLVKCDAITADSEQDGAFSYWRVTYRFVLQREGWLKNLLNIGSYHLEAADSTVIKRFTDEAGHPILGLLSTDGTKVEGADAATYTTYSVYRQVDFSRLNLPGAGDSNLPLPPEPGAEPPPLTEEESGRPIERFFN